MSELPDSVAISRFWAKVDKSGECWLWRGHTSVGGYGDFAVWKNRHYGAHRLAYELLVGPIPDGLHIDHLCRVRNCVNPAHLEPVTCKENLLRGQTFQAANARKTHCIHGHPFDDSNTYWRPAGGRGCRTCRSAWDRMHRRGSKEGGTSHEA